MLEGSPGSLLLVVVLLLLRVAVFAQSPQPVAIHAGHVLRRDDRQDVGRSNAGDRRRKNRQHRSPRPRRSLPADAVRIDLPNATILPGHDRRAHASDHGSGVWLRNLAISVPREALIGAKNARVTLLAGFTTVRNVGASGYTDVALRDAINAGDVPGPRMLVSGPAARHHRRPLRRQLLPSISRGRRWRGRRRRRPCSTRSARTSSMAPT